MAGVLIEADPPSAGVQVREFVIVAEGVVARRVEGIVPALLPCGEDHFPYFFGIRTPSSRCMRTVKLPRPIGKADTVVLLHEGASVHFGREDGGEYRYVGPN